MKFANNLVLELKTVLLLSCFLGCFLAVPTFGEISAEARISLSVFLEPTEEQVFSTNSASIACIPTLQKLKASCEQPQYANYVINQNGQDMRVLVQPI
jgi:hypothetical protein